jgi:uncharacterized protein GlcG (DUF336 family)
MKTKLTKGVFSGLLLLAGLLFFSCENPTGGTKDETPVPNTAELKVSFNSQIIENEGEIQKEAFEAVYVNENPDEYSEITIALENTGDSDLRLTGSPTIIKLNNSTSIFSISRQPDKTTLKKGEKTTFTIRFKPATTTNLVNTEVLIPNTGKNAPEFSFTVYGQGRRERPEIKIFNGETEISVNGTISLGETTISRSNTVLITIKNTGRLPLELTGNPLIKLSGNDAGNFTISTQPTKNISVGGSSTFEVRFEPEHVGEAGATITIENNDTAFTFYITGSGVMLTPILKIFQGAEEIAQNGTVNMGEVIITQTGTIGITLRNTGAAPLTVDVANITITGTDAVAFTKTTNPGANISPGNESQFSIQCSPIREGENNAVLTIPTNDNARNPAVIYLASTGVILKPMLKIFQGAEEIAQSGTVDMGEVIITQTGTIGITLRNAGAAPLTVDVANITITGSDQNAFTAATNPSANISPGNESQFTIQCSPTRQGENNAVLTSPTNDSTRNPAVVYLKATGVPGAAVLELSQGATAIGNNALIPWDFGQVETGTSKPLVFTIKNTGNIPLQLTNTPMIQSSDPAFTISSQPAASSILPGSSVPFIVQYSPLEEGNNSAEITILNNSADLLFTLKVGGTGFIKKPQIIMRQGNTTISNKGTYNFGTIAAGKTKSVTFTIGNSGDANLSFIQENNNRINLADNEEGLYTVTQQPTASTVVTPGNTTTFTVQFDPIAVGNSFAATVAIKTNSRDNSEFTFTISGNARASKTEARLSGLQFSRGKLNQQFNANINAYTLNIDASLTYVNVIPVSMDTDITSLKVNGVSQNSGVASQDIILASTPTVSIVVTAEDGTTTSPYTVTINRIVNYSSADIAHFWVSNMDESDKEDMVNLIDAIANGDIYWEALPDETQLKFMVQLANSNATVKINGSSIANGTFTTGYLLNSGTVTEFDFTIISEDGENELTFTLESRYRGTEWERVGFLNGLKYAPVEFTVVVHNNQFVLTIGDEVYRSSDGTSWTKSFTFPASNYIDHSSHSTVIFNNTMYNIGGYKGNSSNEWNIAPIISSSTNGTNYSVASSVTGLTNGVANHTSVVFNNYIYTIGGGTNTVLQTNTIWRSTNGTTWQSVTAPGWGVRAGHASVVYNNKIYITGGYYNNGESEYRDVWSTANGTAWTQETSSASWTGRNDHTLNANSKGMWLVGGNDGDFKNDVWFSRDGKDWTQVLENAPFDERANHAAVVRDGYLYIFGGANEGWDEFNYVYDIWRTWIGE